MLSIEETTKNDKIIKYFETNENYKKIKNKLTFCIKEILSNWCFPVKENEIILDTQFFILIANLDNYGPIMNSAISLIEEILKTNETIIVHLNMKSFTLTHLEKHYSFIKNICILLQEKFPDKLEKCLVYNAPFLFAQLFSIVSKFIDKKTQKKIKLI